MKLLGYCDNCGKLKMLTRYKANGDEDLCIDCYTDKEYKILMDKGSKI